MCISADVSLTTFLISVISSLLLIYYGKPEYQRENLVVGLFLLYIASVQLLEFCLWIDIHNTYGINTIATLILPLYVYLQPPILYILQTWIYHISPPVWMWIVLCIYGLMTCIQYIIYVQHERPLMTSCLHGTINWTWISHHYLISVIHYVFFIYAIFAFMPFILASIMGAFLVIINSISFFYYKRHFGSFFCFLGAFFSLFFLCIEYIFL